MKNKLFAVVCAVAVVFLLNCTFVAAAQSDAADSVDDLISGILAFNEKAAGVDTVEEWIDTALVSGAGSTSEWYAIALRQSGGGYDLSEYAAALSDFASKNSVTSAVSRQRLALALISCGKSDDPFVSSTANDSIGEQGVMSLIFGLHLLNNGCACDVYSAQDVIHMLLELRLDDGGWAITGAVSDVDVTAMALCALAPYYGANDTLTAKVDSALELLSNRQLDSGAFKSFGTENPESTSQVIIALCALGVDALSDARFIKNGSTLLDGLLKFRLDDGSISHFEDGVFNYTATVQAFCSLVALRMASQGNGMLFVFDGTEELSDGDTSSEHPAEISGEESAESAPAEKTSYKVWACIALCVTALIVCAVLFLCGRKNYKNYILVLAAASLLILALFLIDIKSAEDYYSGSDGAASDTLIGTVTMTIRCDTAVRKSDSEYIPADGTVLPVTEFGIAGGESVYDVLMRAAKKFGIQMENDGGAYGLAYISGINYLYEYDFGELSGWMYTVNGTVPSVGCSEYILSDGDVIEWHYTCDLGNDLG